MIVQIVKRRQQTKRAGSRGLARSKIVIGDFDSRVVNVVLAEDNSTRRARVRFTVQCEVPEFGIFPEGPGVQVAEFATGERADIPDSIVVHVDKRSRQTRRAKSGRQAWNRIVTSAILDSIVVQVDKRSWQTRRAESGRLTENRIVTRAILDSMVVQIDKRSRSIVEGEEVDDIKSMIVIEGKAIVDTISIQRRHAGATQEMSSRTSKAKAESMRLAQNRDGIYSITVVRVEEEVDETSLGNNRGFARNRISLEL
jgi:hypothetical protein